MSTPLQESRRRQKDIHPSGENVPEDATIVPPAADEWDRLLDLCSRRFGEDSQLYGSLKGFRVYGAVVQGGRILPGTYAADEWEHDRAVWLMPHRAELTALLKDVAA